MSNYIFVEKKFEEYLREAIKFAHENHLDHHALHILRHLLERGIDGRSTSQKEDIPPNGYVYHEIE